jgi:hypothetical protein
MPPEVVEIIAPFLALVGFGGAILIGMKMRYTHIQRTRGIGSPQGVEQLTEAIKTLHDDMRLLHEEVLALNERVEFTERLLERPRTAESDPEAARRRRS